MREVDLPQSSAVTPQGSFFPVFHRPERSRPCVASKRIGAETTRRVTIATTAPTPPTKAQPGATVPHARKLSRYGISFEMAQFEERYSKGTAEQKVP